MEGDAGQTLSPWITAFSGGLAGSILTVFAQTFLRWYDRPVLAVEFDRNIPGCEVRTPALEVIRDTAEVVGSRQQHYLRLRVRNRGKTSARAVQAFLVSIARKDADGAHAIFDDEVLDLRVSMIGGTKVDVLPQGCHRFFDLAHVTSRDASVTYEFDVEVTPYRLAGLRFGSGEYTARVHVAAENATSTTNTISWSWDGTLGGLKIAPVFA